MYSDFEKVKNYTSDPKENTSLITIISPKMNVQFLRDLIKQEKTTAENIKNNSNRKSVMIALKNVESAVEDMKKIPDNGIAIFAGRYI